MGRPRPEMQRPVEYTEQWADEICERLADGESLKSICTPEHMPGKATVFRWLLRYPHFEDKYIRAREAQADAIFDEILNIADDGSNDWIEKNGEVVLNSEAINRSRLRVDARKWMAGKLRPKKYGDRVGREDDGDGGKNELVITVKGGMPSE